MSNKLKRFVFFISSIIVSTIVPLIAILSKYKIIQKFKTQTTKVKVSIIAAIAIIVIFVLTFKRIIKYLDGKPFSFGACVIKGLLKLIPFVCVLLVLTNILKFIDDLTYVVGWITGCNAISLLIIDPFVAKYTYALKRDEQIELIKEGVRGATK